MPSYSPLPRELGDEFSTVRAQRLGVTAGRLRSSDLEASFRGARMRGPTSAEIDAEAELSKQYKLRHERELALIRSLGRILVPGQFVSHRSAALLWEAPMPWAREPLLHATALRPKTKPRIRGVIGHAMNVERCGIRQRDGVEVADPATTWAMLADLPLTELVAVGDYFVRVYRPGYGRRNVGRPPHATIADLERAVSLRRWRGQPRLERALRLIREDSWSPKESAVRVELVTAGLPEPVLNVDLFDVEGSFIACPDMVYPEYRVAVEYQGEMHNETYAEDIERIERLRAAGWIVIQVTKVLLARPRELVRRVERDLCARGWRG